MKTLTKLFVAVALLAAGFACTTDATDDLGINTNTVGQTSITISLDETRTQLGAEADGVYPVTWSEGDAISVNGVASQSIAIDESGKTATFTFAGAVNYPYCIAYPAAEEGKVLFAAQQSHTESTFAQGAATMYGYAEAESGMSLSHLTGVLKIAVQGDKILSYAQISTIDRAPIAGAFAVDFASGKVSPTAESTAVINYSFGEGVKLSSTPIYMHIAVPEGIYDELYITLYDTEGGVSYARTKADEQKPLAAGVVRNYSTPIDYTPLTALYVIKDVASLKALPSATSDAILVCDIDLSGEAWTSLKGYSGTINGNGYAIKGLTAPLFESTSATIKGLHLEGVNITSSKLTSMGALVGTYSGTEISHCSASGNITLTRASTAVTNLSALIGSITTASNYTVSDCTNNCVMNLTLSSTNSKYNFNVGGVVGFTADVADTVEGHFVNNTNNAAITVSTPEGGSLASTFNMGGVLGYIGFVDTYIDGCHNTANITANIASTTGVTVVGGAAGAVYRATSGKTDYVVDANNITNSGKVTVNVNSTAAINVAGCFARLCDDKHTASMKVENFVNSGAIALNSDTSCSGKVYMGGIVGWGVNSMACKNLHNEATGTVTATMASKTGEEFHIGGLFGYLRVLKLSNMSAKDCYNKAQISSNLTAAECKHNVGGCFGLLFPFTTNTYDITLDNVDNYGGILINCGNKKSDTNVGGIVGGMTDGAQNTATTNVFKIVNCDNVGDSNSKFHFTNGTYATFHVGGITGPSFSHIDMDDCSNSMDFLFDADKATTTNMWGGCVVRFTPQVKVEGRTTTIDNFTNTGNALFTPKTSIAGYNVYSGFLSYMAADGPVHAVVANNIVNRGNIKVVSPLISNTLFVGGFGGYYQYKNSLTMSNSTNYGSIDITTEQTKLNTFLAGFVATTYHAGANLVFTNCHNEESATISFHTSKHEVDYNHFVGGLLGLPRVGVELNNCSNKADVTLTGNNTFPTETSYTVVGGIFGRFHGTFLNLSDVTNTGDIIIGTDEKPFSINAILNVGGIGGSVEGTATCTYDFKAPVLNTGDILYTNVTIGNLAASYIGGVLGETTVPISNVSAICDIKAMNCPNKGMIMGIPYAEATKVTNFTVGGSIITNYNIEDEVYTATNLDQSNYFNHIYGTPIEQSVAEADGGSCISVIK